MDFDGGANCALAEGGGFVERYLGGVFGLRGLCVAQSIFVVVVMWWWGQLFREILREAARLGCETLRLTVWDPRRDDTNIDTRVVHCQRLIWGLRDGLWRSSADVLEAAGVKVDLGPAGVARCVEELGVGFMFAPGYHSAMKHAIGPRRELGVRTLFNLLGPLTNPANAPCQVIGVFSSAWCAPIAEVMQRLGSEHVMVVHGQDGLDEISPVEPTHVAELRMGEVRNYTIEPATFGVTAHSLQPLRAASADESYTMIRQALGGRAGSVADMIALNAGAGIYVAGLTSTLADGVNQAREVLASGTALKTLNGLAALSQQL